MRPSSSRRRPSVDALEPRKLLAATTIAGAAQEAVATAIPAHLSTDSTYGTSINLAGTSTQAAVFTDPNVPGTLVTFETSKGNILVSLTDTATPLEVANFLSYVTSGAYDDTIFHREANIADGTQTDFSPADPATIIQGGGYTVGSSGLTHITTTGTVNDEYTTEAYTNLAGTIAGAKTSAANSTSSEWFFNVSDNTDLDPATTETSGTGYTVFGKVLSGMNVITTIAGLPGDPKILTPDATDASDETFTPVTGLTQAQITANTAAIGGSNLVYLYDVVQQASTTYTVTSTDPTLVNPVVSTAGVLTFTYGTAPAGGTAGAGGTAEVTVTATDKFDGTTATTSFAVTVPPTTASTGPVAAADTVPSVVTGVATAVRPLANDTDSTSALNPATLAVVTQPAHGTAVVDPTTGIVTYTATGGYTGTDSFTYTVSDLGTTTVAAATSAATTVTLDVIAAPASITIGGAKNPIRSLAFTQPNGVRGRLALSSGSAVVTFSPGALTQATRGGVDTVAGAGATIADVVVTNSKPLALPTLTISSTGKGTATLGGLSDAAGMMAIVAPTTTLTGDLSVTTLDRLTLAAATNANLSIVDTVGPTVIRLDTATDTSLTAGLVTSLTSRKWTVDNTTGTYAVQVSAIGNLTVPGGFADNLIATNGGGYGITTATVGTPSGRWEVNALVKRVTVTSPASTWALDVGSTIQTLTVRGALTGDSSDTTVSAAAITDLAVTGAMTNAIIETSAAFNAAATQLQHLTVGGAMTGSIVFAAGNVNAISAASMSDSRIYAGVNASVSQASGLPTATTDLSALATIRSVSLHAGKATFADSEIAAYTLDAVRLGKVTASNGGTAFGVSAHTLDALSAVLDPGGALVLSRAQLKSAATLSAYITAKKKSLSDFAIDLY